MSTPPTDQCGWRRVIEAREPHGGVCKLVLTRDDRRRVLRHFYGNVRATALLGQAQAEQLAATVLDGYGLLVE